MDSFDGKQVVGSEVRITKAGDGLSDALELNPKEYPHGSRVRVVLEGVVSQVNYRPPKKGDVDNTLVRVHTITTEAIAEALDASVSVSAVLEHAGDVAREAAEARKKAELEASGIYELGDDDEYEDDDEAATAAVAAAFADGDE